MASQTKLVMRKIKRLFSFSLFFQLTDNLIWQGFDISHGACLIFFFGEVRPTLAIFNLGGQISTAILLLIYFQNRCRRTLNGLEDLVQRYLVTLL